MSKHAEPHAGLNKDKESACTVIVTSASAHSAHAVHPRGLAILVGSADVLGPRLVFCAPWAPSSMIDGF